MERPIVGTIIGDPCGIGPEVTVKALGTGRVHQVCRPVLIGSAHAVREAVRIAGLSARVRTIASPSELADEVGVIDVIDSRALATADITVGRDNEACGRATGLWLDEADALARSGEIAAVAMGAISSVAMKMAGTLDRLVAPDPGEEYLVLFSGALRVAHLTDHVPLARVCRDITADLVLHALATVNNHFSAWGIPNPRIGVAGLNPHAMGEEEDRHIAPGVAKARSQGINADGPISPDAIFRQCIEGKYDVVLAMFHDQGHIAVKTWGFAGNCATNIGKRPYVFMGTAHGTAFDIAGRGIADHSMMLNAMVTAGSLAAGKGFPS